MRLIQVRLQIYYEGNNFKFPKFLVNVFFYAFLFLAQSFVLAMFLLFTSLQLFSAWFKLCCLSAIFCLCLLYSCSALSTWKILEIKSKGNIFFVWTLKIVLYKISRNNIFYNQLLRNNYANSPLSPSAWSLASSSVPTVGSPWNCCCPVPEPPSPIKHLIANSTTTIIIPNFPFTD